MLRALVIATIVLFSTAANAQAFRPRGKTPSTKPAAKATAAPSKQPTRAAGPTPRRVVVTKPESETTVKSAPAPTKAKPKGKAKGKEDIVIVDDDEDDVQIKDE